MDKLISAERTHYDEPAHLDKLTGVVRVFTIQPERVELQIRGHMKRGYRGNAVRKNRYMGASLTIEQARETVQALQSWIDDQGSKGNG